MAPLNSSRGSTRTNEILAIFRPHPAALRVHDPAAGWKNLAVLLPAGGKIIHHPSVARLNMKGPGFYEISGIAFSGNGRISKVDVSADGGKSWAQSALGCGARGALRKIRRGRGTPLAKPSRRLSAAIGPQPAKSPDHHPPAWSGAILFWSSASASTRRNVVVGQ